MRGRLVLTLLALGAAWAPATGAVVPMDCLDVTLPVVTERVLVQCAVRPDRGSSTIAVPAGAAWDLHVQGVELLGTLRVTNDAGALAYACTFALGAQHCATHAGAGDREGWWLSELELTAGMGAATVDWRAL